MILDRFRLTGRAAVVTGAGRGIGAAIAVAFAEAGADVVVSARSAEQLADVARQVEAAGRRAVAVPADLRDLDAAAGLAATASDAFGRLDIVVNNVGGAMPGPFLMTAPRHLERAFQFNVAIAHALTQAAVPHLLDSVKSDDAPGVPNGGSTGGASPQEAAGGGGPVAPRGRVPVRTASVINVSSVIGRVAGRGYLAYGTAKAALAHYTRLAAADLAPRIRVNAIAAGAVATSALDIVMADDTLRGQLEQATPLGRIADPEDIAAAAVFLASPAASYVTGRVLEVDGGIDRPNLDLGLPDL